MDRLRLLVQLSRERLMTHQILTRLTWSGVSQGTSVVMSTRGLSEGTRVAGGGRPFDPSQAGPCLREQPIGDPLQAGEACIWAKHSEKL